MKRIFCRGYSPEMHDFVIGYYTCFNGDEHRIYDGYAETDCGDYYPDWWQIIPETVGRFTGLTDKKKERIFEDDIVIHHSIPMLVKWDDNSASFVVGYTMNGQYYENTLHGNGYLEVIGNIHENPNLLD